MRKRLEIVLNEKTMQFILCARCGESKPVVKYLNYPGVCVDCLNTEIRLRSPNLKYRQRRQIKEKVQELLRLYKEEPRSKKLKFAKDIRDAKEKEMLVEQLRLAV